jgi:hypothetical protein
MALFARVTDKDIAHNLWGHPTPQTNGELIVQLSDKNSDIFPIDWSHLASFWRKLRKIPAFPYPISVIFGSLCQ